MELLEVIMKEFVAIAEHLKDECEINNNLICVDKKTLIELFDRNPYIDSRRKLLIWSNLDWIKRDEKQYTTIVYHKSDKKIKRVIAIKIKVVDQLKELTNVEI